MSIDHEAVTIVGYVITVEGFFKPLAKKRKGSSHMEDRFDPKNGKKLAPVKVVDDPGGYDVVIGERTFDGPEGDDWDSWVPFEDEIQETLEEELDCEVQFVGDMYNGCSFFVCLSPKNVKKKDDVYLLKDVCKAQEEVDRIGKILKKWKIKAGVAGIHSVMSVS